MRGVNLGKLVAEPLKKYAHLTGKDGNLTEHLNKKFHLVNQMRAKEFIKTMRLDQENVAV